MDSDVPWIPTVNRPRPEARIFHVDVDPLKAQMPLWYIPARLRLRADAAIGPLGLDAEIERRRALHVARLQAYREIERRDFPADKSLPRETRIQHLILKTGIMYEESWVEWAAEVLQVLGETATP